MKLQIFLFILALMATSFAIYPDPFVPDSGIDWSIDYPNIEYTPTSMTGDQTGETTFHGEVNIYGPAVELDCINTDSDVILHFDTLNYIMECTYSESGGAHYNCVYDRPTSSGRYSYHVCVLANPDCGYIETCAIEQIVTFIPLEGGSSGGGSYDRDEDAVSPITTLTSGINEFIQSILGSLGIDGSGGNSTICIGAMAMIAILFFFFILGKKKKRKKR